MSLKIMVVNSLRAKLEKCHSSYSDSILENQPRRKLYYILYIGGGYSSVVLKELGVTLAMLGMIIGCSGIQYYLEMKMP